MSIVEKALKKLADAAAVQAAARGDSNQTPAPVVTVRHPIDSAGRVSSTRTHEPQRPRRESARVVDIHPSSLRAAGLMAPEHEERRISREYRQIKRPLLSNAIGRGGPRLANGHLIMVASAVPGEGKTFTSMNLAMSLARETDLQTVLVDADVAKPHISRVLGVEGEAGLLDALQDPDLDIESLVLPTSVPSLSLLPAGKRSENATELLGSSRMQEIARQLGEYDSRRIVLFDSPPLLLTTESHALATVMGQIVVVVRANSTLRSIVLDALSYLNHRPGVSLLLNQTSNPDDAGNYYQYGYDDKASNAGAK